MDDLLTFINELSIFPDDNITNIKIIINPTTPKKYIIGYNNDKTTKIIIKDNKKMITKYKYHNIYHEYNFDKNDEDIIKCINNLL